MIRKIIATIVAGAMFFNLTLSAAASPLSTEPVSNTYTQSAGAKAEPQPDFFPAVVIAAAAVGFVAGYNAGQAAGDGQPQHVTLSPVAETALD
jgi:hypothetical protein